MKKSLLSTLILMLMLSSVPVLAHPNKQPNMNFNQRPPMEKMRPIPHQPKMQPIPYYPRGFAGLNLNIGNFMLNIGI